MVPEGSHNYQEDLLDNSIAFLLFTTVNELHISLVIVSNVNFTLGTKTKGREGNTKYGKSYILHLDPKDKLSTDNNEILMGNVHVFLNEYNALWT